jgi:hypothetical protein
MTKREKSSKKMGEAQIIDFFSSCLRDEMYHKFGPNISYSIGNFSGSQDRKFADYFSGTSSSNILIEFKELKREAEDEWKKPLRKKLCLELTNETASQSRSSHFIAWGSGEQDLTVKLTPYVDLICTKYIGIPPLIPHAEQVHSEFIDAFLSGTQGVNQEEFVSYIEHLNKTAGGCADGKTVPFKSVLYSRNDSGKLVGTRFENLGQLIYLYKKQKNKKPRA